MPIGELAEAQGYSIKIHSKLAKMFRDSLLVTIGKATPWHNPFTELVINKKRYSICFNRDYSRYYGSKPNKINVSYYIGNRQWDSKDADVITFEVKKDELLVEVQSTPGYAEGVNLVKQMFLELLNELDPKTVKNKQSKTIYSVKIEDIIKYVYDQEQLEKAAKLQKEFNKTSAEFKKKILDFLSENPIEDLAENLDRLEGEAVCSLVTSKVRPKKLSSSSNQSKNS
jgi:hypothetical protein